MPLRPLLWLPFREITSGPGGLKYTENKSGHPGTPKYCMLGDGTSGIPTQLAGGGMQFGTGQYIRTGIVDNDTYRPWTFFVACKQCFVPPSLGVTNGRTIFCSMDAAVRSGFGILFRTARFGSANPEMNFLRANGLSPASAISSSYSGLRADIAGNKLYTFALTADGSNSASGVLHYRNGAPIAATAATSTLGSNPAASGKEFLINAVWSGSSVTPETYPVSDALLHTSIFDYVLSPNEVLELHRRVTHEAAIP